MVCDEVMAGFGRTGRWFAVDHWDVVPDLMTMAKGLTSSYLPLGAVAMRDHIADAMTEMFYGGLTYSSHPVSLAAALATIGVYEEDDLIGNAARIGRGAAPPPRGHGRPAPVRRAPTATSACSASSTSSGATTRGRRSPRSTGRATR